MQIITFQVHSRTRWGALQNGRAIDLNAVNDARGVLMYRAQSVLDFLHAGHAAWENARETLTWLGNREIPEGTFALDDVKLLAPLPRPGKIMAIGLNYRDHARETGAAIPTKPILFAKFPSAVIGPYDTIRLHPDQTQRVDYEAELGVVIGKPASRVQRADALDYVFGYTVLNDVSARDIQKDKTYGNQWVRGKSLDTFCPMGPAITSHDAVTDPQNLNVRASLNGTVMQDGTTREMIFDVATLIEYLSHGITLEPGDVIATGTPPGVGDARQPPIYLKAGDVIEIQIEGLGKLSNPVAD
ncbi:fumarylacetoacetate hydrolase family protein [Anaerolineae bacterium CFX7]|nr:fumarylacetoacetate hydrolase family protein [Anaerolineae bacterium CFX7]